jgi:hypothetical protein
VAQLTTAAAVGPRNPKPGKGSPFRNGETLTPLLGLLRHNEFDNHVLSPLARRATRRSGASCVQSSAFLDDARAVAEGGARTSGNVIEQWRRMIGAHFGVPPSAVRISIDLGEATNDENRAR